MKGENPFGEIISEYTRQQAIEDGVLVDITNSELVKNAGFKIPVCITKTVFNLAGVPEGLEGLQDFNGRLWDILWLGVIKFKNCLKGCKARGINPDGYCNHLLYCVDMRQKPGGNGLKCMDFIIAFNRWEGFTIMRPEDD